MIAAITASAILSTLALIHFYWAFGGTKGVAAAVPASRGQPLFKPGPMATTGVGIGLLGLAALFFVTGVRLAPQAAQWGLRTMTALAGLVFAARAVGDFRYLGFFKRAREGRFAWLDTYAYSPLCLALAILAGAVALG